MDEYFENTTPEQLIEHLKALGVKFVDIKDSTMTTLTLLEQLNKSPKWAEFEKWYKEQSYGIPLYDYGISELGFVSLPIEFQIGVFEKFIYTDSYYTIGVDYYLYIKNKPCKAFDTFKELLIYYFNEI